MEPQTQNGNKRFTLPTFGCTDCDSRKAIMGAGNWQMDAAIFALIGIALFCMWKLKVTDV